MISLVHTSNKNIMLFHICTEKKASLKKTNKLKHVCINIEVSISSIRAKSSYMVPLILSQLLVGIITLLDY